MLDNTKGNKRAKFEVMEMVDTLMNLKKEILEARAPAGLFPERTLCTDECCVGA